MVKDYDAYKAKVEELDKAKASHKVSTALVKQGSYHPEIKKNEARLVALADDASWFKAAIVYVLFALFATQRRLHTLFFYCHPSSYYPSPFPFSLTFPHLLTSNVWFSATKARLGFMKKYPDAFNTKANQSHLKAATDNLNSAKNAVQQILVLQRSE